MKFRYLGTAASEGWTALFCNCEYCLKAKKLGGKNLRTRSQAIVNDDMLIDFPGDTFAHMLATGMDFSKVRWCLVTHSHCDHFVPIDLCFHAEGCYAHNMTEKQLTVIGNEAVKAHFDRDNPSYGEDNGATAIEVIPLYQPRQYGKYIVTALRANHMPSEEAHIYIISDGEKTMLYLHDTGLLFDEAWDYLIKSNTKADFVSYDCTFVALPSGGGHMGLDSCTVTRDRFLKEGIIDNHTINCINHFSHNGMLVHDELVPVAEKLGFLTAYDGMEIEF